MKKVWLGVVLVVPFLVGTTDCPEAQTDSGVTRTTAQVKVGADGLTVEQRNVKRRVEEDNKLGTIKHCYGFSSFTGDLLYYAPVDGKVTSSGKRLLPHEVKSAEGDEFTVNIGGHTHFTREVLGDDGTYGSSSEYVYFWDTKGIYTQIIPVGGTLLVCRSEPLALLPGKVKIELK